MFAEMRERSIIYAATEPADVNAAPENNVRRKTIVTRALLGGDAGLYGAASIPLLRN